MKNNKGFTLVEIMIVVAIIGILIAIAVPGFLRAREISRQRACQENLTKIDGAKQQWALETRQTAGAPEPGWDVLVGDDLFIRFTPQCPSGGTYTIGALADPPACSESTTANFQHVFNEGS
jgi:prepilin-type N-terminal cleavage/methylation domain-containing protein